MLTTFLPLNLKKISLCIYGTCKGIKIQTEHFGLFQTHLSTAGAVRASLTFLQLSKTDLFLLFILIPISIFKAEGYGR